MPSAVETIALVVAGLGFFFIGISGLKTHLQQLANRKFRRMVAGWMRVPGLSALWGFLFGAITQSSTAVTFIVSGFVSGGLIRLSQALSLIGWANIGTTVLVFAAAVDIKIAALYMIGASSLAVTFNFAGRHKTLLNVLYSVGLMFFGLRTMREAFGILPQYSWFPALVGFLQGSDLAAFVGGALLRVVIQSSSAIVVLAITLAVSGILTETQAILLTFGTGVGVAFASYMLAGHLRGIPRQIVLFQIATSAAAALIALLLTLAEEWTNTPLLLGYIERLPGQAANHIAFAYLALMTISVILSLAGSRIAPRVLAQLSPATPEEDIATAQFLLDDPLDDPELVLDLVDKEQQRFLGLIPRLLPSSRQSEAENGPVETTHASLMSLAKEIRATLLEQLNQGLPFELSERVLNLDHRQGMLDALEENTFQFARLSVATATDVALRDLDSQLVESVDGVMLLAADAIKSRDADDIAMLSSMTGAA